MRRISATLTPALLTTLLAAGLTACSSGGDDESPARGLAEDLAGALAADAVLEAKERPALADLPFGTDATEVAADYAEVVDAMGLLEPTVTVDDVAEGDSGTTTATLAWSWPVADDETWDYTTHAELTETGGDWSLTWDRAIVEESLTAKQTLDLTALTPDRGDITGAGGATLVTERPVQRYGIDKSAVPLPQALSAARTLAQAVGVDVAPYVTAVKSSGESAFVEAITYRKGEAPPAATQLQGRLDGLLVVDDSLALAPTKEFAAPILGRVGPVTAEMVEAAPETYRAGDVAGLSGLQSRYDERLRGTPGVRVEAVSPRGRRTLFEIEAVDGKPLATTLDEQLQISAEALLADVGPASALVAIRPSDGAILAAANGPGTDGQNYATYGQAAPGSTFKIVSALALLRDGVAPTDRLPCTPTVTVDGREFENYDDYPASALGDIPLATALAQSCNTAFISTHDRLAKNDLADAAGSLGLGIDHDLGFPAYFGQVPPAASETEGAADLIGQGKILASPMVMAAVIASVQHGGTVIPRLLGEDVVEPAEPTGEPLTEGEAERLHTMLRGVVTSGSGALLADVPGAPVIAKTGTAEFADPDAPGGIGLHAWMVAAQGDLAVAVYVERGASGSATAGPILEEFLRAAG